jgi:hypothetical protein
MGGVRPSNAAGQEPMDNGIPAYLFNPQKLPNLLKINHYLSEFAGQNSGSLWYSARQ